MMGVMPIRKLVLQMSWPIMLSMLMQAVYNLVDSMFVARVSDEAFLALSYAYPVQTLLIAYCVGLGVAFSATLSKRIGEGEAEEATNVINHGFFLFLMGWVVFFLFGLFLAPAFLRSCTDTAEVAKLGSDYLRICCCLSIGTCIQFPIERILQATGHPSGFMIVQGSGALLNLILDPIFIFTFGLGVTGAALATVIGQIIGACIGVVLLVRYNRHLPFSFHAAPLQGRILREIGTIAVPAILMQSLISVMSLGMNAILRLYSETAVWVLGSYFKIQTFVLMPIFSINNALISIISYNYGAGKRARASQAVRFSLWLSVLIASMGGLLLWLTASPLLVYCFKAGPAALALGVPSLRYTCLSFPIASVSIIFSAAFQSLDFNRYSLAISLLRFLILPLPIALLLVLRAPTLVFFSFLITELLTVIPSMVLYGRVKRTTLDG